jgi:hypothetical protein
MQIVDLTCSYFRSCRDMSILALVPFIIYSANAAEIPAGCYSTTLSGVWTSARVQIQIAEGNCIRVSLRLLESDSYDHGIYEGDYPGNYGYDPTSTVITSSSFRLVNLTVVHPYHDVTFSAKYSETGSSIETDLFGTLRLGNCKDQKDFFRGIKSPAAFHPINWCIPDAFRNNFPRTSNSWFNTDPGKERRKYKSPGMRRVANGLITSSNALAILVSIFCLSISLI